MPGLPRKNKWFSERIAGFLPPAEWVVFSALLFLTATSTVANMLADCDTGVHVRAGEWILAHRALPDNDLWSSASPHLPWVLHEWLSQVIFGWVHGSFGLAGVVVLCALVIAASYAVLCRWVLEHGNHPVVSLSLVLLVLAASRIHWLARPHVFTFLSFVLWYRQLHLYAARGETFRLWLLPPAMVLWANLHGGFVTGFALLGMYLFAEMLNTGKNKPVLESSIAARRAKALGVCLGACLVAACVNPYGPKLLMFPFELQGNQDFLRGVMEFKSPDFHAKLFLVFEFFLLFAVGVLAMSSRPLPVLAVMLLLFHLDMALYSARHITLFCMVAAPILAESLRHVPGLPPPGVPSRVRKGWPGPALGVASVLAVCVMAATGTGVSGEFSAKTKPVAAVAHLAANPPAGPMFNNDEFGDYAIYAGAPFPVFTDGRADIYGKKRFPEYMKVMELKPGWEDAFSGNGIEWAFLRSDTPLSWALWKRPAEWALVYSDGVADVYVRRDGVNREMAKAATGLAPRKPPAEEEPKTFWGKVWRALL